MQSSPISSDTAPREVLITGGSDGIGKGLAARLLARGWRVLVTGRDADKLQQAAQQLPGLLTRVNDIGIAAEREALARHVQQQLPSLQMVINNAGIQRRIGLAADDADWATRQAEIDILLAAPIHLNHLLLPQLLARDAAATIVNVTSAGAYIPQPFAPVYSACKAALHSYTVNLRFALRQTRCRVVEVIPPAVQTGLAGPGRNHGTPLDDFCDHVISTLIETRHEQCGYGPTASDSFLQAQQPLQQMFEAASQRFKVDTY